MRGRDRRQERRERAQLSGPDTEEEETQAVPRLKSTMGDREFAVLLNRAAAVIENPTSETRSDRDDLVRQLTTEAAKRDPDL